MQFNDIAVPGNLVKHVNVLGDHGRKPPGCFETGQESVSESRPDAGKQMGEVFSKLIKMSGIPLEASDFESHFRIVSTGDVNPLGAAKIGDSRGGGKARTGQGNDIGGVLDKGDYLSQIIQRVHSLIHLDGIKQYHHSESKVCSSLCRDEYEIKNRLPLPVYHVVLGNQLPVTWGIDNQVDVRRTIAVLAGEMT